MIDHTGVTVADFQRAKAIYAVGFALLGYRLRVEVPGLRSGAGGAAGFGIAPKPDFWVGQGSPNRPPLHVAIRAETRRQVEAFHAAALAAGGRDNGAPGLRKHYHAKYYGAFVLDPEGDNIEAVCHAPD